MADFRSIQTRIWREDEWFVELPVDARLFWIYLFSNPSASPAGIYRLPVKTMASESGLLERRITELFADFSQRHKAHYEDGVVWIVKMRDLQFPDMDGSGAWQTATRMAKDIDAIPDRSALKQRYLQELGYPSVVEEAVVGGKTRRKVCITFGSGSGERPEERERPPETPQEVIDALCTRYENVMGMMGTSILPDVIEYIGRLHARSVTDWWLLALQETVQAADRPTWQYMKAVLENWLAAGEPSTGGQQTRNSKRGTNELGITGSADRTRRHAQTTATQADADAIAAAISSASARM